MFYQIIVSNNENTTVLTNRADSRTNLADVAIPTDDRASLHEALLLHYLMVAISHQDQIDDAVHSMALAFLTRHLATYKLWLDIHAEFGLIAMRIQERKAANSGLELSVEELILRMVEYMVDRGLYFAGMSEFGMKSAASRLIDKICEYEARIKKKSLSVSPSYNVDMLVADTHQLMFAKLGITPANNNKLPEDYLVANFMTNAAEPLLHVRQCEQSGCRLDTRKEKDAALAFQMLKSELDRFINKTVTDKSQTIFYGSFASGLLLRDLQNIELLIKSGYKKFKILLVDKSYEDLIRCLNGEDIEINVARQTEMTLLNKALSEFASWIADNTEASEAEPLQIHLFANTQDAEKFMASQQQKLSLLIGQDYFIKNGTDNPQLKTDEAHTDFMQLACAAVDRNGLVLELVKAKKGFYLHTATIKDNQYSPVMIVQYVPDKPMHMSFFQPLREFTGQPDTIAPLPVATLRGS